MFANIISLVAGLMYAATKEETMKEVFKGPPYGSNRRPLGEIIDLRNHRQQAANVIPLPLPTPPVTNTAPVVSTTTWRGRSRPVKTYAVGDYQKDKVIQLYGIIANKDESDQNRIMAALTLRTRIRGIYGATKYTWEVNRVVDYAKECKWDEIPKPLNDVMKDFLPEEVAEVVEVVEPVKEVAAEVLTQERYFSHYEGGKNFECIRGECEDAYDVYLPKKFEEAEYESTAEDEDRFRCLPMTD